MDIGDVGWHMARSLQGTQNCLSWAAWAPIAGTGEGAVPAHQVCVAWKNVCLPELPVGSVAISGSHTLFTWHGPGHRRLAWFECSVLNKTVRNKELPRFLLLQISPVPTLLKHTSSQMTCPGLSLYSQRKLVAAFFGVSFSWLRPSHANKDLFFLLTKTTLRRKFFPMTKVRLEFFNRMSKQKVSGKGSIWGDFTCNFSFHS